MKTYGFDVMWKGKPIDEIEVLAETEEEAQAQANQEVKYYINARLSYEVKHEHDRKVQA